MKTGQNCLFSNKTVGRVNYRYRLLHRWVSEMMLNVQSVLPLDLSNHKAVNEAILKLNVTYLGDSFS